MDGQVVRTLAYYISIESSLQALFVAFPSNWAVSTAREVIIYQRTLT